MNDAELEARLRRFRPRRPAPLPDAARRSGVAWPQLAIAATLTLVVGGGLFVVSRPYPGVPVVPDLREDVPATLGSMTRLASESPERLDEVLTNASRGLLPDVGQPPGSLRQLAK